MLYLKSPTVDVKIFSYLFPFLCAPHKHIMYVDGILVKVKQIGRIIKDRNKRLSLYRRLQSVGNFEISVEFASSFVTITANEERYATFCLVVFSLATIFFGL